MSTFVGWNIQLFLGAGLFIFPFVARLSFVERLPKSSKLYLVLPKGGVRIVLMTIVGSIFAALSKRLFTNVHDFITWGFVFLSIPAFIMSVLELLSENEERFSWNRSSIAKWAYRSGSVIIFYLIIEIVTGHNLISVITDLIS